MNAVGRFRIKGISYKHAAEYYAAHVPGGLRAIGDASDPGLYAFLTQPFTSSGWYDIYPMREADLASSRLLGQSLDRFVRDIARASARREFLGVYKLFLRMLKPATIAEWVPRLGTQYFDFGKVTKVAVGTNEATFRMSGLPSDLADWMQWSANEYLRLALEMNGCHGIVLRNEPLAPDGESGGVPLSRRNVIVRWE